MKDLWANPNFIEDFIESRRSAPSQVPDVSGLADRGGRNRTTLALEAEGPNTATPLKLPWSGPKLSPNRSCTILLTFLLSAT